MITVIFKPTEGEPVKYRFEARDAVPIIPRTGEFADIKGQGTCKVKAVRHGWGFNNSTTITIYLGKPIP
jgi:hypothetical protein